MYDEMTALMDFESVTGTSFATGPGRGSFPEWSGIVHDLRNLLQTASSAINIIDRGSNVATPHVRQAIDGAKASVGHASELVVRTLGAARPAQCPTTSAEECLAEIAAVVGNGFGPTIELDFVLEADLPRLACDKTGLQNALLNLIMNARDAIPGNGRIGLRARVATGDNDEPEIEISVADDGVGMSAKTIECAFDLYFTTKADGLGGIGLPMVERFVTSSGGSIAIDSEPGAGTIVSLRLPSSPYHQRTSVEDKR